MTTPSMNIVYIGDPLCSWCWGIAGELQKLRAAYEGQIGFKLILGGLRPGGTETIGGKLGPFLAHHWDQVTELSGQPISHDILKQEDFVYDTEPPCRAIRVARALDSAKEFDFFKAVQEAFYVRNEDTNQLKTYLDLCDAFGFDKTAFEKFYKNDDMKAATQADFQMSRQIGITSFPTVLLQVGEELHVLARGYARFEQMDLEIKETVSMA